MKSVIHVGKDGLWYWRIVARNGKIIADGAEGYAKRGNASRALRSFIRKIQAVDVKATAGT